MENLTLVLMIGICVLFGQLIFDVITYIVNYKRDQSAVEMQKTLNILAERNKDITKQYEESTREKNQIINSFVTEIRRLQAQTNDYKYEDLSKLMTSTPNEEESEH